MTSLARCGMSGDCDLQNSNTAHLCNCISARKRRPDNSTRLSYIDLSIIHSFCEKEDSCISRYTCIVHVRGTAIWNGLPKAPSSSIACNVQVRRVIVHALSEEIQLT